MNTNYEDIQKANIFDNFSNDTGFEKGKKAVEGEIREWKGKKYRKQNNKWVPVSSKSKNASGTKLALEVLALQKQGKGVEEIEDILQEKYDIDIESLQDKINQVVPKFYKSK